MVKEDYYENNWTLRAHELSAKEQLNSNETESLNAMVTSPDVENNHIGQELIRLKIVDALTKGLNEGQTKALIEVVNFFRSDDHDAFCIKGYAGTGKTHLVRRVIEYITTAYPNRKIAITAPTNKAVHVLHKNSPFGNNIPIFEAYGKPTTKLVYSTIHKLLGLKEQISANGAQNFVTGEDVDITKYSYLIVDEVSMLNDDLFEKLMKFKHKVKFIFMGDPAQIPPIGKEHCIPFTENCPYDLKKVVLSEIMRQKKGNPLVAASMGLRKNLTAVNPIDVKTALTLDGEGLIAINGKIPEERARIKFLINNYFKKPEYALDSDYVKIIAWKNKTVAYLNDAVRTVLYGEDKRKFNVGDKLIANKALFNRMKAKWGFQYTIKANTSDEFTITKIETSHKSFTEKGKGPTVSFSGKFWRLTVETAQNDMLFLNVLHDDSIRDFNEALQEVKEIAVSASSKNHWMLFYNMLKWTDDVIHNYAITVHKSQGSTYENVILIEEDLNDNRKIVERNRIKYTAYTRASKRLYVLR